MQCWVQQVESCVQLSLPGGLLEKYVDLMSYFCTVQTRLPNPAGEKRLELSTNTGVTPKHFTTRLRNRKAYKRFTGIVYNATDPAG